MRAYSDYKNGFIEFMAQSGALTFGEFKTKSGRLSPYFVNTGNYRTGSQMARLGEYYSDCYMDKIGKAVDVLYGPAYKGIPLVVSASTALFRNHNMDIPFCFNRKEVKDHGEGGIMIGCQPKPGDSIVIVEDVITAGTALRETMQILKEVAGEVKVEALIIQVDRMERAQGNLSAVQQAQHDFGIPVYSIVTVEDIMAHHCVDNEIKAKIERYLEEYGAK